MRPDAALEAHLQALGQCRRCPGMLGPPVYGLPVRSPVMLIGQAPGEREREALRPFTWTAGKRLFGWFERVGLPEPEFRKRVYMSAVGRCFPGKNPKGGDRVPTRAEIANCRAWLEAELALQQPALLILVGKLAISAFLPEQPLAATVGRVHRLRTPAADAIPLPHPSGASTWIHTEPGRSLLARALDELARHPAWQSLRAAPP